MINIIRSILIEELRKTNWEFQVRNIDGPLYYKRLVGEKTWSFTDEVDFYKNSTKNNIIKWQKKI